MADRVYHLELRAFPHVSRVFNLDREALDVRFLKPWSAGEMIDHDDRRWAADKTRLVVVHGPEVDAATRGMGRGWGEATRAGEDVTETVIAEVQRGARARPEIEALKDVLSETAAGAGVGFTDAVALAAAAHPTWRASEQLALAEQAVWEALHQGRLELLDSDLAPIPAERWPDAVLSWAAWAGTVTPPPRLRAPAPDSRHRAG